jgi:hypothetical protein
MPVIRLRDIPRTSQTTRISLCRHQTHQTGHHSSHPVRTGLWTFAQSTSEIDNGFRDDRSCENAIGARACAAVPLTTGWGADVMARNAFVAIGPARAG